MVIKKHKTDIQSRLQKVKNHFRDQEEDNDAHADTSQNIDEDADRIDYLNYLAKMPLDENMNMVYTEISASSKPGLHGNKKKVFNPISVNFGDMTMPIH